MSSGNWTIFFTRPISASLMALTILLLLMSLVSLLARRDWRNRLAAAEGDKR
jgi:TctA family transporter